MPAELDATLVEIAMWLRAHKQHRYADKCLEAAAKIGQHKQDFEELHKQFVLKMRGH